MTPRDSENVLVYDTNTGALSGISSAAFATGPLKWTGLVNYENKLWATPSNADVVLQARTRVMRRSPECEIQANLWPARAKNVSKLWRNSLPIFVLELVARNFTKNHTHIRRGTKQTSFAARLWEFGGPKKRDSKPGPLTLHPIPPPNFTANNPLILSYYIIPHSLHISSLGWRVQALFSWGDGRRTHIRLG